MSTAIQAVRAADLMFILVQALSIENNTCSRIIWYTMARDSCDNP